MHNIPLNYAISNAANGATFAPTFTTQTAANNPTLFSQFNVSGISQVTYPEFYYIPNSNGTPSGNLVFDYRNAASASGGGSGNGNTYFGQYNASTSSFTAPSEILDGGITSVNGYQNRLVYDSNGNLDMTWTWRSTPNFQSNNNILFAQSPDNGVTWYQQGGKTQYTLPIIASTADGGTTPQVAQTIQAIAQNSSLINQASMTVDKNNNPVLATWLTPNGNASLPVSATNNPNLQYELIYYTGTAWEESQITHRTSDTAFDTSGTYVRDLGRPIVLVDSENRVLVVTRSEDTGMGSYSNPSTPNNNLVVYWNTMAGLDSATPTAWKSFALDDANLGEYEPSYDPTAWTASNTLDLFYEPVGLSGETTGSAEVLQWNESTFNFATATPSALIWDANSSVAGIQDGSGTWNLTNTNFSDGNSNYSWNTTYAQSATFGAANAAAGTVTLGTNISVANLIFNTPGSGSYNIAGGGYTLTVAASPTIIVKASAMISAPISTSGTVTKTGAGTLTLSGNNTINGTIVLGTGATSGGNVNGALCINSAAAVNGVSLISLTDNNSAYAVFQLNGSSGNITLPSSVAFNLDADSAGTGSLGATIFENIAGNDTVAGPITFNVGGKGFGFAVDSGSLTFTANLTTNHFLYLRGAGNGAFTGNLSSTASVEVDGPGIWTFAGTDTYSGTTVVAGGSMNLSGGASIASTSVTGSGIFTRTISSLNISSGGIVNLLPAGSSVNRTLLVTATPTLAGVSGSWQSELNLGNNDLIAHNGSLAVLTNQLKQGYNSGQSNAAAGITSSAAAADTTHLTALGIVQDTLSGATSGALLYGSGTTLGSFDGYSPVATDVLLKYTYYGDTNLDGKVDGSDYSRIDAGFLSNGAMTGWYNGDFNYDGVINGSDYTLIDNAFNTQGAAITDTVELARITAEIAPSPVPEPATPALAGAATLTLLARRRRFTARE
jgi:autotransporter-associated beta strand protein